MEVQVDKKMELAIGIGTIKWLIGFILKFRIP